jgi:hypothetical protein
MPDAILACSADRSGAVTTCSANVPWTPDERSVWDEIQCRRGRKRAASIRELRVLIHMIDGREISEREVKAAVNGLIVRHRLRIGSSRQKPPGYYLIDSADEMEATCRPLERQAVQMFRRVRALRGAGDCRLLELAGQITMEAGEGQ